MYFQDLLGHPLCSALIRYKWNRFGRYVYLVMLLLYLLFLLALTVYTVAAPAPYSPRQITEHAKYESITHLSASHTF